MVEIKARHSYRILVSDDDERCRETVREVLEPFGYDTELASCGEEAIAIVRRHIVHVMIIDMNMPDMTGLDTVTIIRREIVTPLPSILMSADSSVDLMRKAISARFETFMPKPIDIRALREIVDRIILRHYEQ